MFTLLQIYNKLQAASSGFGIPEARCYFTSLCIPPEMHDNARLTFRFLSSHLLKGQSLLSLTGVKT